MLPDAERTDGDLSLAWIAVILESNVNESINEKFNPFCQIFMAPEIKN